MIQVRDACSAIQNTCSGRDYPIKIVCNTSVAREGTSVLISSFIFTSQNIISFHFITNSGEEADFIIQSLLTERAASKTFSNIPNSCKKLYILDFLEKRPEKLSL